ncbi:MAG: glycosyltransferase [Ancalomicrobiaceae bacterium]|nr:glycosyltransferase [Ancalomicrobiaceae bacterium]
MHLSSGGSSALRDALRVFPRSALKPRPSLIPLLDRYRNRRSDAFETDGEPIELQILTRIGFSGRALALSGTIAARRGTSLAEELTRIGALDGETWWQSVADHLGLDYLSHLRLPALPPEVPLPDPRTFSRIRQVWIGEAPRRTLVVAPRGAEIDAVAAAIATDPTLAARLIISSPEAIRRAFRQQHELPLSREACDGLQLGQPAMSAADGATLAHRAVILAAVMALALWFLPRSTLYVFDLAFLTVGLIRLIAAMAPSAPDPPLRLDASDLPSYAVLVPLYHEAEIVDDLIRALGRLDYPLDRRRILMIVEADDLDTRVAAERAAGALRAEVIAVPPSRPRTKPKALAYALNLVETDLVVIYDAEDRPEPEQLRKAAAAFACGPGDLVCVQAALDIDHAAPSENWLARQFALEYRVLFRAVLPWLARNGLFLPLGGTSNHFRRDRLVAAGGWDPCNVTEDADIAIRLVRAGGRLGTIDSVTTEEAPLKWLAWNRQRIRWMKGWLGTWIVHMRQPARLMRDVGPVGFALIQLLLLGQIVSALMFPFGLGLLAYDTAVAVAGGLELTPGVGLPLGLQLVPFGIGFGGAAVAAVVTGRRYGYCVRVSDLVSLPAYWVLLCVATISAFGEIMSAPHRWNKTRHGLALRIKTGGGTGAGGTRRRPDGDRRPKP